MWKFSNPIKHAIPETNWPSEEDARRSLLFQPIRIGQTELTSRTWVPAMVPWRATDDGFVTQANIDWYRRFAAGQPGALVVEATGVRDIPRAHLRIGDDRFIPGLRHLAKAVREASKGRIRLFIQIIDFLAVKRRPDPEKYFDRFLQVTNRHRSALAEINHDKDWLSNDEADVRSFLARSGPELLELVLDDRELESLRFGYRERVTDTELAHIRELPQVLPGIFADAAARARSLGLTASSFITLTLIRWPPF